MTENKPTAAEKTKVKLELEQLLDKLSSKKSRITFFDKAIKTDKIKPAEVPDKYLNDILEIEIPEERHNGTFMPGAVPKLIKCPARKKQVYFMAQIAERAEKLEQASKLYKDAGCEKEAILCARRAGLDELAEKWIDEYLQMEFKPPKSEHEFSPDPCIDFAATRAQELGLKERAKKIVSDYLKPFADKAIEEDCTESPEFLENLAKLAEEYKVQSYAQLFYKKAMQIHEEEGDYDDALRVARALEDSEKIQLYDSLRYIVADHRRREKIEQDRADDADGSEFEFGTQE